MTLPILEVKNLKKFFPICTGMFRRETGSLKAVNDVSFSIGEKEVVGIVGESGCGKSTLGRAAIRLIEPTSGTIRFLGEDLLTLNKHKMLEARKKMQMVFQDPQAALNPRKTIGETIGEALLYHKIVRSNKACQKQVCETMELIGLSPDTIDRYPHQFSGGQQQRICIGRAIAMKPKLLVCDEAVSALDVSVQAQIINLLNQLKELIGMSYLFISHDLSVIRHLCDRVVVLYLGKVMEEATTEELFNNPKHPYTQALLSSIPKDHPNQHKERKPLKGEIPSPANPPSGCPFRTRCPFAREACEQTPPVKKINDNHTYHCILD